MNVKATIIEMVWDNYQGASGLPIQRSVLIDLQDHIRLDDILNEVIHAITSQGIKGSYNPTEKTFPYQNIISIEIMTEFGSTYSTK